MVSVESQSAPGKVALWSNPDLGHFRNGVAPQLLLPLQGLS